jgi:hypothetical protein
MSNVHEKKGWEIRKPGKMCKVLHWFMRDDRQPADA